MQAKKLLGLASILLTFSSSVIAGIPNTSEFSRDYDIGTLTIDTPYMNTFRGVTNALQHSYTFDLDAPATVEARFFNLRTESGVFLGFPPLTHTVFDLNFWDSGIKKLYEGETTATYPFGSTSQEVVTGEVPAGNDYFLLITGTQTNDISLEYMTQISIIPTAVPEPETYAMFLGGLGLMGFVIRRRKQN